MFKRCNRRRTRTPNRIYLVLQDIIREVARAQSEKKYIPTPDIRDIIDAFLAKVRWSLIDAEEVRIQNFGTFYRHLKQRRRLIEPKTKKEKFIPAHYEIRFKQGQKLKVLTGFARD